jgi:hypothetical protein
MDSRSSRFGLFAIGAILAATLLGCGPRGSENAEPAPPSNTGTLSVSMTDVPACGLEAANITVNRVRAHTDPNAGDQDAGWVNISPTPVQKVDLLELNNGALAALGEARLPAGHYTQLRVELASNTATSLANSVVPTATAVETALDTPSGGIRVGNEFDVAVGQRVELVLDFDVCRSIFTNGSGNNYVLKPSIKVAPTSANGITGFVIAGLARSHVMVSAQQGGEIVQSTVPGANGVFFLARLPTGSYDVVITADGRAASVITGVPVATTISTTPVSTSDAPIGMAPSIVASISGVVTLDPVNADVPAFVAAKQTFARGPTVTIRYQGADLSTGAYTLGPLPLVAPRIAAYRRDLPLVFADNPGGIPDAGRYEVQASAAGYITQSEATVDVTAVDQRNVDFTLDQ